MYKQKLVITYHAITPVHFGAGESLSYVDNAIQREKHTEFPMLAGSGIKGVIRELASRKWDKDKVDIIFGPWEGSSDYSSCISFTDAKILLFPVRSVRGVFAWITCPYVLKRFKDELESLGFSTNIEIPKVDDSKVLICNKDSQLKIDDNKVALEEFVFEIDKSNSADSIANELKNKNKKYLPSQLQNEIEKRLAIVSDNVFRDFVKYAVEVRTRIRINQTTGTVDAERGGLFTVELVPAEAVFYGFVFIANPYFGISAELYDELEKIIKQNPSPTWNDIENEINSRITQLKNSSNDEDKKKGGKWENDWNKKKEVLKKAWEGNYFSACKIKQELIKESPDNERILKENLIQFGGDETLGMGLMRVNVYDFQPQGQAGGSNT